MKAKLKNRDTDGLGLTPENGMTFWTWNATEKRADSEKSRKY